MSDYNKNIFDELNEISPYMAGLSRNNPFTIPEGNFQILPDSIMLQIKTSSLTADSTTTLAPGVSGESHWQIPEGYFDEFAEKMLVRMRREAHQHRPMTGRVFFMRYAMAAAFTGLLGLSLFSLMDQRSTEPDLREIMTEANRMMEDRSVEEALNTLQEEEIIAFLEENGHDVETALVANAASRSELPEEFDYLSNENTLDDFLDEIDIRPK